MEHLFLSSLNMSLTASYVVLFLIVMRIFFRNSPKIISYIMWSVVAFRLLIPFSFKGVFSLIPKSLNTMIPLQHSMYAEGVGIDNRIEMLSKTIYGIIPKVEDYSSENWIKTGICIWVSGMAVMLFYVVFSVLRLKHKLKNAKLSEPGIYEMESLKTAFVLGVLRPKIYLPVGLLKEDRKYILLHEKVHIKRKDHIVKIFAFLILTIHWFNPFVWLSFALMTEDMELSCDEKVLSMAEISSKKSYAMSLLNVAMRKHFFSITALSFGGGEIKTRIKNVLNYKRPKVLGSVLSIILSIFVAVGLMTDYSNESIFNKQLVEYKESSKSEEMKEDRAIYHINRNKENNSAKMEKERKEEDKKDRNEKSDSKEMYSAVFKENDLALSENNEEFILAVFKEGKIDTIKGNLESIKKQTKLSDMNEYSVCIQGEDGNFITGGL